LGGVAGPRAEEGGVDCAAGVEGDGEDGATCALGDGDWLVESNGEVKVLSDFVAAVGDWGDAGDGGCRVNRDVDGFVGCAENAGCAVGS
jgi:hypothetical protein